MTAERPTDPILIRRARVARIVSIGRRLGYGLLLMFALLAIVGFSTGFPTAITTSAYGALVAGSLVLAPSIVVGYAVKAADREDRNGDWR